MEEQWKEISGYEGIYQVSNLGAVKAVTRNTRNQFSKGLIKKMQLNRYGYLMTMLSNKDKIKLCTIHRLVASAFLPNPDLKPQINHIDGNKENNNLTNLEWCNASENQFHRFCSLGHITHNRALTKEEVFHVLSKKGRGWKKQLAISLGVSEACIKAVRSGRNYNSWFNEFSCLSAESQTRYTLLNHGLVC